MVKQFLFLVLIYNCCTINAQINLVPNPSFEDTVNCPYVAGDIDKAQGWISLCGSPDYFNICNQYDWGVPINICGYQMPASGNAYAGFITYSDVAPETREFPACVLSSPLTTGVKYFISFKVALVLDPIYNPANCASNNVGLMFTDGVGICNGLVTNNPSVYTNIIITDSMNWTRVSGVFNADQPYTHLAVGNFFDDVNTDTIKFFNSWWSDFSYYYLDDVCVSTDSVYALNYEYVSANEYNPIDQITYYPNPAQETLTIQNSSNEFMTVEIYNLMGELIYDNHNIQDQMLKIELVDIDSGLFILRIKTGQNINTYRVLKL